LATGFGWARKGDALIASAGDDKPSTTAVANNAMRFFMGSPFS
jgi:hypothetical protein